MDSYEYFNSRDVAEHCKQLSRSFTGRELAYMIWQSNHHTLAQKVAAWEELIRTMPNETLEDGIGLHHFLRQYITRLQQFISEFQGDAEDCVYSYEKLYKHAPEHKNTGFCAKIMVGTFVSTIILITSPKRYLLF